MPRFDLANYVDVQERINTFWHDWPEGAIRTRLMSPPDDFDHCRYEAAIYRQHHDEKPAATGYAVEFAGGAGANQTSWEENGETSAIGRALANMGYAKNRDDRPSRQEMEKVERGPAEPYRPPAKSNYPPPAANRVSNGNNGPTPAQRNFMNGLAKDLGWVVVGQDGESHHNPEEMDLEVNQLYPGKKVDTLTVAEASELIDQWKQKKAELVAIQRD